MTDIFRAPNPPICRHILEMLRKGGLYAGDIATTLGISKPNISRYFAQLRQADLAGSRKQGPFDSILY